MPGIFGLLLRQPCPDARIRAKRLSRNLCQFDWQRSEVLEADPGRVFLGVAWNDLASTARGAACCVRSGVFCVVEGRIARAREDFGAGPSVAAGHHAEAAILAYQRFGVEFPSRLEGPYALILYDRDRDVLLGVTERHGLSPLYRYDGAEAVFFCSMLGPMAGSGFFKAAIDQGSAATFLGHHHLFYQQSLLRDVVLQDPATVAAVRTGAACVRTRYWHYGYMGPRGDVPYRRRLDDLCDTLIAATDRLLATDDRLCASLSGGFDSRLVTGLVLRRGQRPTAWTFGADEATDLAIAKEICRRYELRHLIYRPDPSQILDHVSSYVTLINGCGPAAYAFWLKRCHELRGEADLVFNGYRGGVLLGDAIVDLGLERRLAWQLGRLRLGPRVLSPNIEDAIDADSMSAYYVALSHSAKPGVAAWTAVPEPPLTGMFQDALNGALAQVDPEYRIEQWTEEFGGGRHFTLLGIIADRHFYADASHFYDYDVRDRCIALAPRARRGRKAYIEVLRRLVPDLAHLPYANTGLPADSPAWLVQSTKVLRRLAGRRRALSTGTSPSEWLREPRLRDFCGDVLCSRRCRGRSWWKGEAIAAVFEAYQKGANSMAAELWNAVTLELFARRWLDGDASEVSKEKP